jgi:signal transduction histidine kinase
VPAAELPIEQLSSPYQGLSGEQVIGKASPIENTDWQVVIEISASEANRGLTSLLIILGAILLFGVSLAIWMARLFSRWLLQPIHTLQESAERITAGDFSHRIELNRSDELGFLAAAVNQMVAALEQTIKELRTVSLNLLSAQESERRRVAQEIHDELGQTLTALRLNLWMALQSDPENQTLSATHRQATEVQETARTLSHELRPAMLDDLGLLPTLEWYIDRVEQRANLAIVLETDFDESMISSGMKTALYRLIVEALTNITKHASASVAEICLNAREQGLHLIIQDDGAGFDTAILNQTQSLGLAGMRERVNLLQGQFLIESNLEQGTRITIDLPLNE